MCWEQRSDPNILADAVEGALGLDEINRRLRAAKRQRAIIADDEALFVGREKTCSGSSEEAKGRHS